MNNFLHHNPAGKDCILCGRCLEVCPLLAATGQEELSPRAKHQLAHSVRQAGADAVSAKKLAAICLACGRCEAACPQGLCAPDLVAAMRAAHPGMQEWLWKVWMHNSDSLWPALARMASALPETKRSKKLRAMQPGKAPAPWITAHESQAPVARAAPLVLFPGCLASGVRGDWLSKAASLLTKQGQRLQQTPNWACCGCTLGHAGLQEQQRAAREQNILAWRNAGAPRIAVFCATCRCGLRAYATDHSLSWKPGEALAFQQSVVSLSEVLDPLLVTLHPDAPKRVHYHRPCHGAGRKAGKSADQVFLERILGGRLLLPAAGQCCGMGGIMQLGAPDLSRAVADLCWSSYEAQAGDHMLTGCSGCVLQLAATAPEGVHVGHWLDVVAL